jgi:DUF1365 family protein
MLAWPCAGIEAMVDFASALYRGRVVHARARPAHRLSARVFSLLIDLDELPALDRGLRRFSHNRWNVLSFYDRDHGPRDGTALRPWIEAQCARAGLDIAGGRVRLLCFPRLWGYAFNPLSVWYCHGRDGALLAVLYEVRNTMGDWHGYLVPAPPHAPGALLQQRCAKLFHVSPLIGMEGTYRFRLAEPGARLSLLVRVMGPEGEIMAASPFALREALDDRAILGVVARHPLMTFKVIAAIHWHALRLWLKGARFHKRPKPPAESVSVAKDDVRRAA